MLLVGRHQEGGTELLLLLLQLELLHQHALVVDVARVGGAGQPELLDGRQLLLLLETRQARHGRAGGRCAEAMLLACRRPARLEHLGGELAEGALRGVNLGLVVLNTNSYY